MSVFQESMYQTFTNNLCWVCVTLIIISINSNTCVVTDGQEIQQHGKLNCHHGDEGIYCTSTSGVAKDSSLWAPMLGASFGFLFYGA